VAPRSRFELATLRLTACTVYGSRWRFRESNWTRIRNLASLERPERGRRVPAKCHTTGTETRKPLTHIKRMRGFVVSNESALETDAPLIATLLAMSDDSHMVGCFRFHLASHWGMRNEETSLHALLAQELFVLLTVTVLHPMNWCDIVSPFAPDHTLGPSE
jgi:hypothetical protein